MYFELLNKLSPCLVAPCLHSSLPLFQHFEFLTPSSYYSYYHTLPFSSAFPKAKTSIFSSSSHSPKHSLIPNPYIILLTSSQTLAYSSSSSLSSMAVALSRARSEQLQLQRKCNDLEANIDNNEIVAQKRMVVPVVYYLARNGQLEHPHFMEVPLSSPQGLFLRDVISRLNLLRGKSMASHYSWSSKRSYKSGYVWHDLEENDYIHPVHGGEYVLKGSEILETTSSSSPCISKSPGTSSSSSGPKTTTSCSGARDTDFPAARNRRRNQSWGSSMDLQEYKVYKTESTHEFTGKAAADASTQTDDKRRRRKAVIIKEEPEIEEEELRQKFESQQQQSMELSREEISPPPSDSSPETLESLMKADGKLIISTSSALVAIDKDNSETEEVNRTAGYCPSGRMKASSVLMSLISCGSMSFRDCGATAVKDHGLSLISSHYKARPPCGSASKAEENDMVVEMERNVSSKFAKMALEDKEYFSGSLIETNKNDQFSVLKRSSSYNADRSSHLNLEEKEIDRVRAKCIPRRPSKKKECTADITAVTINSTQDGEQH